MKNSPLVEIIAEVRWGPGRPHGESMVVIGGDQSQYVKMGIEVGKHGYNQLERTFPEGFPSPGGAIAYRYRKSEGEPNTLFQMGTGIFTANGLPPYNAWREFRPVIELGLNSLWSTASIPTGEQVHLVLRYIDAFEPKHLAGLSPSKFFEEVVGVDYTAPNSVGKFLPGPSAPVMRFASSHKSADGRELLIEAGEGTKDGASVVVLNTTAQAAPFVPSSVDEVLANFDPLHDALHDAFFEMVERSQQISNALRGGEA